MLVYLKNNAWTIVIMVAFLVISMICLKLLSKEKNTAIEKIKLEKNSVIQVLYSPKQYLSGDLQLQDGNNKIMLKEVINGKTLLYRFTENSCASCYEAELKNIEKIKRSLNNKVIILTSFTHINDVTNFKKKYNIDVATYNYSDAIMDLDAKLPYYFVLDNSLQAQSVFIPDYTLNNITNIYFDKITELFHTDDLDRNINWKKTSSIDDTVTFDKENIDLGIVNKKKVFIDFLFTNTSKYPVIINKVSTSCGCTIADFDKKPILPSTVSKIKVIFNAEFNNIFNNKIFVFMNTKNSPVMLTIKGIIKLDSAHYLR